MIGLYYMSRGKAHKVTWGSGSHGPFQPQGSARGCQWGMLEDRYTKDAFWAPHGPSVAFRDPEVSTSASTAMKVLSDQSDRHQDDTDDSTPTV